MISTMVRQLIKDASIEELKNAGLDTHYVEHNIKVNNFSLS